MHIEVERSGLGPNGMGVCVRTGLSTSPPPARAQVEPGMERTGEKRAASGGTTGAAAIRRLIAVVLAAGLLAAPLAAFAGTHTKAVSKESGMGAAAALSSIFYSPVKLVYAAGGLLIGSLAWVFTAGDTDVADKIYVRSVRGTYVITPEILRGEEPLVFIGRDPSVMPVEDPKAVAAGPAPTVEASAADEYTADAYGDTGW